MHLRDCLDKVSLTVAAVVYMLFYIICVVYRASIYHVYILLCG